MEHKLKTFLSPKQKLEYDRMTGQASEESKRNERSERSEKGREAAV